MSSARDENFIADPSAFTALTQIHKLPITECCFSPDSNQILTGSEDKTVVLWNLPPKETELHDETLNDEHKLVCYRLSDHKSPVTSVAIHRKLFLSADKDGRVKLWKLLPESSTYSKSSDCNSLTHFKKPCPEPITYNCPTKIIIRSLTFSRNADRFATGSDDKSVKIWPTDRRKPLTSLLGGHKNWIKCVRWSKTCGDLLASCGDDGLICIWDTRTKVNRQPPAQILSAKRRMIFNCLDWHPVFDHHIATGAHDASCIVWDLRNSKQVQVYVEHTEAVNSIAFNSGGSLLLTGSSDKTSKIFDVCEGRNMFTLKSHKDSVTSVCFDSTGDMFATGSKDNTVTVWKRNFDTVNIVYDDGASELDPADDDDLTIEDELMSHELDRYDRYRSDLRHHHYYNNK